MKNERYPLLPVLCHIVGIVKCNQEDSTTEKCLHNEAYDMNARGMSDKRRDDRVMNEIDVIDR